MALSGMLDKAPWRLKLVAPKSVLFGQHIFYILKNVLPTFRDQETSQKKAVSLAFFLKPEALATLCGIPTGPDQPE